jgi:ABC-type methionine transport system ATPase subunit
LPELSIEPQDTIRVQLNYPPGVVEQPILYRLVKEFGLVPNVRRANIDLRTGGFLFLELSGARESLKRAITWLQEQGIAVDAIGIDGAQEWAI